MRHLVTYKAISGVMGSGDEYTVITDHPMHMSSGVEAFVQDKAAKHGYNAGNMSTLEVCRIVIMFIKELDRH